MKVIDNSTCIAISWNRNYDCFGINAKRIKGNRIIIEEYASSSSLKFEDDSSFNLSASSDAVYAMLIQNVVRVYSHLSPHEKHIIILSGYIPGAVFFDISLPLMSPEDMRDAIAYEIPRQLPCSSEAVYFGYRVVSKAHPNTTSQNLIRVFAVKREEWDRLVDTIRTADIKTDVLISPFVLLDPVLENIKTVYLPDVEKNFYFYKNNDSSIHVPIALIESSSDASAAGINGDSESGPSGKAVISEDMQKQLAAELNNYYLIANSSDENSNKPLPPEYNCAIITSVYTLSKCFAADFNTLIQLPKDIIPERFRGLRISFFSMAAILCILLIGLAIRVWYENNNRLLRIENEIKKVTKKINDLKLRNVKDKKFLDTYLNKIYDAEFGNDDVIRCLLKLTRKTPKGIWVTDFYAKNDTINVTFKVDKNFSDNLSFLKRLAIMVPKDYHERRNRDGSKNVYVKLVYKSPKRKRKTEEDNG